ncbi:type I-C CRISPR-associated endonuclease Cas1c [Sediminispirochaeta smaragdinae]|uniref:CRISPR-associated endonuclease Cas1 n=1 Tax=Sediminispirochaeta smaragdinae (strain DSM 11293 / JCM 15392 / SEBR 4228) TaxID=573413 RepID=E1R0V8_SEDSS|nr:type I-C CRISPR-associated endonuclease Cas1c [Sediminispirochaeta smaragdinae]ADK80207.1 CRISPR-associated protein Cas1 [Sediminispirochaeta smaragdinae DSM 11293]
MKRHSNTLYLMTQGTYCHKENDGIVIKVDGERKAKFPVHNIESIVCFGNILCSPFLLGFCAENNISISYLTENGRFLGRFQGNVSGNVLLRRNQYRWADDPEKTGYVARTIIQGKIINSIAVLNRFLRDSKEVNESVKSAVNELKHILGAVEKSNDLEVIRGIEGIAAKCYFNVFNNLIKQQKDDFVFNGRNKRPPRDEVNALLSFIYVVMMHDIRSALETVGLDPAVGYLHRDRSGRYSLALDLMEEFRSFFADRLILSLINRNQIKKSHFRLTEAKSVLLNDEGKKILLTAYQDRKKEEILHPFINEKCTYGRLFFIQALIFARWVRGDIDGYPPFIWK